MPTRFSDDLFNNTAGSDFIVRRRLPLVIQIVLIFAIAYVAIYVMAATGNNTLFSITLSIVIGALTWFSIYFQSRLRDLVLATEFQNAMLASAAQLSTRFCLIVKRDGAIVYVDSGFQKTFPNFIRSNDRRIEGLMDSAGLPDELIRKINGILSQDSADRILLPLKDDGGAPMPILMSVELLPRPKGYFLLRGRDYVEKRSGEASISTTADMPLIHALKVLPAGILIVDGTGEITFVNPVLETWLGFAPGEIMSRPLKSAAIVYQYAGNDAGRQISVDFTGDIVLQRRDKSLLTLNIQQASLGKSAGFSALLTRADGVKKK